ncbi:PoNe immunity protein domain-containing protein [Pseudomonas lundensis]|uniref:PoNe immunity protein domain-containing protein n=1 Tax=Pseudomonas lundensis TaxID=86185 RepID=UPI003907FC24
MDFISKRRQQFLGEKLYSETMKEIPEVIEMFRRYPAGSGTSVQEGWMISQRRIAVNLYEKLLLEYTAGEPIEPLRQELEDIIKGYEIYAEQLWKLHDDRNEPVFDFVVSDDYAQLMQLVGLCFLLHRQDLLPRLAALQDGIDGENGGTDALFEEFMIHAVGHDKRYESDYLCALRPYEALFYGLTEDEPSKQLKELTLFLSRWYKDLAGCAWYDSHKTGGGYCGYWSFEAGAAVVLLGIEDDSSLYQFLYYPKDLVAWSRANESKYSTNTKTLRDPITAAGIAAGQLCPKSGWWFTPAKANSRRYIQQGIAFPAIEDSDYGTTFWQWSPDQSAPTL